MTRPQQGRIRSAMAATTPASRNINAASVAAANVPSHSLSSGSP